MEYSPQISNTMEVDYQPQNNLVDAGLELRLQQMVDTKFEQLKEFIKNTVIQALDDQHQSGQNKPKHERKSWFSDMLDSVFPRSSSVLDLTPIDSMKHNCDQKDYLSCLKYMLLRRPGTQYTQVLLSATPLKVESYYFIFERLLSLKSLIVPSKLLNEVCFTRINALVPHLSKLEEVQCVCSMVEQFATHCKFIHTLSLYGFTEREDMDINGWHGYIGDILATVIADNFPGLRRLTLDSCGLSVNALSIILEGHKNTLIYLNTTHCLCREEKAFMESYVVEKAKEWDEELVLQKAPNLQEHVQCARKNCPTCCSKYLGLMNRIDSITL